MPPIYQMSIEPDTEQARAHVEQCLGWKFDSREQEGVWLVETLHEIPEGTTLDLHLTDDLMNTVTVTLEWP
jgi:hypothetical protein